MPADIGDIEFRYAKLKTQYVSGGLKYDDYIAAVDALRVQDENGIYWQIRADDGKWVRWDGSTWVPCKRPGPLSQGDAGYATPEKTTVQGSGPGGSESGLATTRFLIMLGRGMATGFIRHIPLMIGTMVLIWLIHTGLLLLVKQGAVTGDPNPLIASILILPGHEAAGLMFWGLLVGLSISIASKIRHGRLPGTVKKIQTTPEFIRSSFNMAGFYSVFLVFIGIFGALFIAGMISNVLVSLQLVIFLFTTLIAQKESLMSKFLQVIGYDLGRTLHIAKDIGNSGVFWTVTVMTGAIAGFFISLLVFPAQFMVLMLILSLLTAGIFIIALLYSKKSPRVTGGG
jgi:hypothetical protein